MTPSGATLRSYEAGGREVIEKFDGPESQVIGCQGQVLAPWPNRVVDGRWTWRDEPYQLSITEPERGHALHGLVRTVTWSVVEHRGDFILMDVLLLVQPGWPFPLHCAVSYRLTDDGLTSTLTTTNVGRGTCPYGAAFHPYLAVAGGAVDQVVLHLPAATWLEVDHRLAPKGRRDTANSSYGFGDGAPIASRRVDTAFTDIPRAPSGRVEATVTDAAGNTTVLWGDPSVRWWQLYTGDTLPERWRRATLALEPMTCAPDALNSGDGLILLEPGESHSMTWGLSCT